MTVHRETQAARAVLMIRPAGFGSNPETLQSNAFQAAPRDGDADLPARAREEFDGLAEALSVAGLTTHVFEGRTDAETPDEVFPNNWVSTHADGTVVLYPMMAESRRRERRPELFEDLDTRFGYRATRVVDLTTHEDRGQYLEGTGSLVLDRTKRIAYAGLSPRTHLDALGDFAQQLDYDVVPFEAVDARGQPIYHTNALMAVGSEFAVICAETIRDDEKRAALLEQLASTGREVIEIRFEQLEAFAANLLELATPEGPIIALSSGAWDALDATRRARLERYGQIVTAPIPTIERFGGGSVRCMLAEIHLPG